MKMLTSYKINTGMATMIWLAISGGVMTAATINTITKANFLFFLNPAGVARPILVRK